MLLALALLAPQRAAIADPPAKPHLSPHEKLRSVDLGAVAFGPGFWGERYETASTVTMPRLWELAGPWAWHNMRVAAGIEKGEAKGCNWEDAWIYKWLEAASYFYALSDDEKLDHQMDEIIAVVAKAQQPDGYLATQVTLRDRERFAMNAHHELYTMGHLMTAASVHRRATGKDNLLQVARRAADYVHKTYKDGPPELANCPINPSIIMGAVDLYRTTGEKRYLELANIIIDNRGRKRGPIGKTPWGWPLGGTDLNQDRTPLRESKEVVGHSVFWSYLYAGAADAYMETGDATLRTALERLWKDLTSSKIYVTGGVCPVHKGLSSHSYKPGERVILNDQVHEAVGHPFDLPNDTAYNETCGQIGNLMWNWRMLRITGDARYADIMEQTLYNAILSGVEVDGTGWSYTNPLRWNGPDQELLSNDAHQRFDPGEKHICCPTNLLRLILSWNNYLYTTSDEALWVHHYADSTLDTPLQGGGHIKLVQQTRYPWDGRVKLNVERVASPKPFKLFLRIPSWTRDATLRVNGAALDRKLAPNSYAAIEREWKTGDVIELNLPMPVRLIAADPRVQQDRNQAAVQRGPIVYCLESTDLPDGVRLEDVHLPRDAKFTDRYRPDLLGGVVVLETEAALLPTYTGADGLYGELPTGETKRISITLIPYYAWNNRGEPKMAVWLPLL